VVGHARRNGEEDLPVALERLRRELAAVQALSEVALRYQDLDHSLRELLEQLIAVLPAEEARIYLVADETGQLVSRAAAGEVPFALPDVLAAQAWGADLLRQEAPFVLKRPQMAPLPNPGRDQPLLLLVAPLANEGAGRGMLLASTRQAHAAGEASLRLLSLAARRAAEVLEEARLFEQVRAGRQRSQALAQQLLEAQETERRRLAHELHDEIGQALTAIKINLQAVQRATEEAALQTHVEESIEVVDRALQQVRGLSLDLRPSVLDDLGLVAALRWYVDRQAQRAGFAAEFSPEPPGLRVASQLETACFRVAQEALTNVARHAGARRVQVHLRKDGPELRLSIRDDGQGFDVPAARRKAAGGGSLGLLGMQERVLLLGGQMEIESAPGQGTLVRARFPLETLPALERRSRRRGG
jgi:signal transduction histidine kinase